MVTTKRKRTITEDDVSLLLQRYSATTILTLLQEIGQFSGSKIDWNALAKKTSTGISCPREYQMLWRHLAYNNSLGEKLEDGAEPLDDDSDLEIEVEAFPAVSAEASAEAAACVKVLMSSGLPNEPNAMNRPTLEAPLTINIPNGQALDSSDKQQTARSTRGLNITVPVSVNKQPFSSVMSAEGPDGNGPASSKLPSKKKRKLWTREEDMELIAAVQKCGEGNWQNILKEDFKHERTASQLSQRWSILRKNWGKTTAGPSGNSNNSTLSEAQLSARQAISVALNMPMIGSLSAIGSGTMQANSPVSSSQPTAPAEASSLFAQNAPSQSQQSMQQANSQKGVLPAQNKFWSVQTKPSSSVKPSTGPNPLIQKAAFAAGGRIANPSTAASLLKAAQSKNAVHIRHLGAFPISQAPVSKSSPSTITLAPRPSNTQGRIGASTNPGTQLNVSGPGNQQATCISSKSSHIAPDGAPLQRPHTQHLSGESTSVDPVNDNACVNSNNKSSQAGPSTMVSELSTGEVGEMEQPKIDSFTLEDDGSAPKSVGVNGCNGEDQGPVNLDVSDCENNVADQDREGAVVNLDVGDNSNLIVDCIANVEVEIKSGSTTENPEAMADVDMDVSIGDHVDSQAGVCEEPGHDGKLPISEDNGVKPSVIEDDQGTRGQHDENQNAAVVVDSNPNATNLVFADTVDQNEKMSESGHVAGET